MPPEPQYYEEQWGKENGKYTLDEENAKNHLKNNELKNGWIQELIDIIEGLKP